MIENIGQRIKEIAENKGFSPRDLSSKTGKSVTAIYDIFKKKDVSSDIIRQFSEILEVPYIFFLEESVDNGSTIQSGIGNFSGTTTGNKIKQKIMPGAEKDTEGLISGNIDKITLHLQECLTEKKSLEKEVIQLQKKNMALQDELLQQYRGRA